MALQNKEMDFKTFCLYKISKTVMSAGVIISDVWWHWILHE